MRTPEVQIPQASVEAEVPPRHGKLPAPAPDGPQIDLHASGSPARCPRFVRLSSADRSGGN